MLTIRTSLAALLLAALLPTLSAAQTDPSRAELQRRVGEQLQSMMGESSRTVVDKLMTIQPEGGISKNFDLARVSRALFGRVAPNAAPDCRSTTTGEREPDEGSCVVDAGDRDSPTGAYTALMFSKNVGIGDIQFARRAAFDPKNEALPKPVRATDAQAYEAAMKFLDLVGVPRSEIPTPPQGVPLPVRDLAVGTIDPNGGKVAPIALAKVVSVQRAFLVPGGLLTGPRGEVLSHVIAPGDAIIAVDDGGVQSANVNGWSDAQFDPKVNPTLAKSTAVLAAEIADDLYAEGVRKVGTMSIIISLRRAYPHPDDPDPPLCPVCGLLLPAVQVMVSQAGAGREDSSEKAWAAPGVVREYDLVDLSEERALR